MFEVYGTDNCTFCNRAKDLLERYQKAYVYIDVGATDDISAAFFKKFPNVSKVPQIMSDELHIGGYEELKKWLNHTE